MGNLGLSVLGGCVYLALRAGARVLLPGFEYWSPFFLAVWCWASYLHSLCLSELENGDENNANLVGDRESHQENVLRVHTRPVAPKKLLKLLLPASLWPGPGQN